MIPVGSKAAILLDIFVLTLCVIWMAVNSTRVSVVSERTSEHINEYICVSI